IKDQDFDALPSEEESFLRELGHTRVINSLNDVVIDQLHQPWRNFASLINRSLSAKTTAFDKLYLSRAHTLWGHVLSKDCRLCGTTFPQMKESKAYKTYLSYAIGTVPPKVARKFKKASPSKKDSVSAVVEEEPIQKGKRVKRSTKKSLTTPTTIIVIREPPVETQSKRKEKVDVAHGKGIDLLVVLVRLLKNHQVLKRSYLLEEHESDSEQDTYGSESDSKFDQQDDDDDEVKDDDDDEVEDDDNADDKSEGDEDRGMDSDDVQDKKADVRMMDARQEKENLEITQEQVIEDAHVTITKKTEVYVTCSSLPRIHTSTLLAVPVLVILEASSVYTNIPQSSQTFTFSPRQSTPSPLPTTKTTNIPPSFLNFALVFRFNDRVIALEKDVAELKNDHLHTQVTAITKQVKNQLPQILPEEVSNFALLVIEKMIQELLNQVNLAKASSQPHSTYEATATLIEFKLKKIQIDKMNSSESYLTAPKHRECYDGLIKSYNLDKDSSPLMMFSKGTKSQPKSSGKSVHTEEPEFKVRDIDTPQGQKGNQGNDNAEPRTESDSRQYNFEECYKALLEKLDWESPEGGDYLFNVSKPLPLITHGSRQSVPVEYFINNDLKYLQGGVSTMTYMMYTTKTKAA
nr:hypothetical protein [Tanacetum cinerariifolium]